MMSRLPVRTRFAPRWAKLVLLFLGLVIGFGLAEAALWALGLPTEPLVFINKETEAWDCYCSNPRGYFVERKASDGRTIYCVDHTKDPPRTASFKDPANANAITVMTVGDSFTWGLGVKVVDSYPYLLGERLRAKASKKVVVSNHAQIGRHVFDIHGMMQSVIAEQGQPEIGIYGYCLNDPDPEIDRPRFWHELPRRPQACTAPKLTTLSTCKRRT